MKNLILCAVIALITAAVQIQSQESVPGCNNLQASDFSQTMIVTRGEGASLVTDATMTEPIQFDLDPIMNGNNIASVDVYLIERKGKVKYFNSTNNSITEIGDIDVRAKIVGGSTDYGLMGIALDPDFKTNNWIYLWWCPRTDDAGNQFGSGDFKRMKLSRYTLNPNSKQIRMNTEKVLIDIKGNISDRWHAGGPMAFDDHGDLWITVGNNSTDHDQSGHSHISTTDSNRSDEWGTSNTASMRGSILRIHPDDNAPKGYTIPKGNFGEYWADHFEKNGNTALAAQYRDPIKMLPEIYTKGHRSNFSIAVHPTKRWFAYGDVNFQGTRDEHTISNAPHFGGYPYFHGNMERTAGHNKSATTPMNNSPLSSGINQLPPVHEATFVNLANVAITGPIYVYDSTLQSDTKFPPHFHEHWFKMNFGGRIHVSKVNNDGSGVVNNSTNQLDGGSRLFSNLRTAGIINAEFGPEGAFYLMNYAGHYNSQSNATGLYRLDYTGDCKPYKAPVIDKISKGLKFTLNSDLLSVNTSEHSISMFNIQGEEVFHFNSEQENNYSLKNWKSKYGLNNGVYLIKLSTDFTSESFKVWINQ